MYVIDYAFLCLVMYKHAIMFLFLNSMIRCKEIHPTSKLSPEELDAIAEIEDSMKDRADVFSEMEAFLPKKNGFDSLMSFSVYLQL